jgi:hypothetical protein
MTNEDVRAVTRKHAHSSITIHVPTNTLVHCFGTRPFVYQSAHDFVLETEQYAQEPETMAVEVCPLGITIAVRKWNDSWLIGSSTMAVANHATFGTEFTLEDEFKRIYGEEAIATLDPALIYIFRLSSSNYLPFPIKDQLALLETRRLDGKLHQSFQFQHQAVVPRAEVRE